jgi:threonine dehydratase
MTLFWGCETNRHNCFHLQVTHSSGNHAQALALAAKLRGIKAYIVMPEGAPAVKRNAVLGYGTERNISLFVRE